jgi:hypothetical protein
MGNIGEYLIRYYMKFTSYFDAALHYRRGCSEWLV